MHRPARQPPRATEHRHTQDDRERQRYGPPDADAIPPRPPPGPCVSTRPPSSAIVTSMATRMDRARFPTSSPAICRGSRGESGRVGARPWRREGVPPHVCAVMLARFGPTGEANPGVPTGPRGGDGVPIDEDPAAAGVAHPVRQRRGPLPRRALHCSGPRAEARLAGRAGTEAMLRCLGGDSPYLGDLALREISPRAAPLCRRGTPDAAAATAMAALAQVQARRPASARGGGICARPVRQVALICALADIAGQWQLEQVTGALSALAEVTLSLATAHLLRAAHDAGGLRRPTPTTPPPVAGSRSSAWASSGRGS